MWLTEDARRHGKITFDLGANTGSTSALWELQRRCQRVRLMERTRRCQRPSIVYASADHPNPQAPRLASGTEFARPRPEPSELGGPVKGGPIRYARPSTYQLGPRGTGPRYISSTF